MAELSFSDGVVSYDVHGQGAPLVLLRGLARSVSHWLGYERQLARDFQVITLDLRGIGRTTRPWGVKTSIYDMGTDVVAVLDSLRIESAHILGVSLGGMVSLGMGIKHPKRCRSLITVNTSIGGTRHLRLTPAAIKTMLAGAYLKAEAFQRELVDLLVGSACPDTRKAEIAKAYLAIASSESMYVPTALRQIVAAGRFLPRRALATLEVPTLIVYGTDDRFVPCANSRQLVQFIPNATLVPIEGGGHELTLDKPDELAEVVRRWVADRG